MPILASLVTQIRTQGGVSVQDRYNELYNKLMNRLAVITKKHGRLVFASGHEHSMHHIEQNGLIQIQTGNASKESAGTLGDGAHFSSGAHGFAVMTTFEDGSSWVRYFGVDQNQDPILMYQKELFPPRKKYDTSKLPYTFPSEISAPIYTRDSINELAYFNTIWGSKYENVYNTPVTVPVATLDSLFGGVTVVSKGSDPDYRSLRLKDAKGNVYRMRALGKNSLQFAEKIKTNGKVENVEDEISVSEGLKSDDYGISFYTATHPYVSMALPMLADKIDIFYTKNNLYYVPKQPRLGRYNEDFGDELYLLSLEPNENSVGQTTFKYPDDIETTDDILIKLRRQGTVKVDERSYIKSRLFDMLIGDWDREKDRWRWAEYFNRDSLNVFVPIPKNRDDAFSSFEGNILDVASSLFGKTTQRHVYDENLNDLKWFNEEGIIFDRALVKRSSRKQWVYLAEEIQKEITDALIEKAFDEIPLEVQDETLDEIKEKLKGRKANLVKIADSYFDILSTLQTIEGTDDDDIIKVTRMPKGLTNVKIYRAEDDEEPVLVTDRTYNNDDTKELWVYGLDGDDTINVQGNLDDAEKEKLTFLRVIGGHGNDRYTITNGTRTKVYDHQSEENTFLEDGGANLRKTDIYALNVYDYRKNVVRKNDITAAIGFNPDDGFRTALQYINQKDGFQRNPFSYKHTFNAGYYSDTQSFDINYNGEFANFKNDRNLSYNLYITSPNYTQNYFGFGNETVNNQDVAGYSFNRIELQKIEANIGLLKNSPFGSFFKIQIGVNAISLKTFNNLSVNAANEVEVDDFNYFGRIEGIYSYRSFDNAANPHRGMLFDLNMGTSTNVQEIGRTYGFLKTRLGFYNTLIPSKSLVLKTNINAKFNFGNQFEFYQSTTLGGETGLRAYREERFAGKSALVGNADLRYSFNEFKIQLIPIQIGIYGGADLGRVWTPARTSDKWHNSYGGGLWVNGSGGLNVNFSAFTATESTRYSFGLGFKF